MRFELTLRKRSLVFKTNTINRSVICPNYIIDFTSANLRFHLNKGKNLNLIKKQLFCLQSCFCQNGDSSHSIFLASSNFRKLTFFLHFLMEFKPANLHFHLNKGKNLNLIKKQLFCLQSCFCQNVDSCHSIFSASSNFRKLTFFLHFLMEFRPASQTASFE